MGYEAYLDMQHDPPWSGADEADEADELARVEREAREACVRCGEAGTEEHKHGEHASLEGDSWFCGAGCWEAWLAKVDEERNAPDEMGAAHDEGG